MAETSGATVPDSGETYPNGSPYRPEIILDRTSTTPLYNQISGPLETLITSGKLSAGTLIEDEVSMARRLTVSRATARQALQDLVGRGLLTRRRGAGTRVTPTRVHRPAGLTSLEDDLRKAHHETKTDVLSYEVILVDEKEANLLHCEKGAEAVRIKRLRWSDNQPLAILINMLPVELAPSLRELSRDGLYACLQAAGVSLATAQQAVSARAASSNQAKLLDVTEGAPLLTLNRIVYDHSGMVVEYGDHVYNAERFTLNFSSSAEQSPSF